jgi:hypothetical protein
MSVASDRSADGIPPERYRATGASLIAIILILVSFVAIMSLHLFRGEIHPVRRVMSDYANGENGVIMTVAFYALGLSAVALGFRLRRALRRNGAARLIPWFLAFGGLSLLAAGVFEVERKAVPDTIEELIHSYATIVAFVLMITAMLLLAFAARSDDRWRRFGWVSALLGSIAAAAAMAGPITAKTTYSGAVQRVMGLTVLLWLMLTAFHVRTSAFRSG